MHDEADQGKKHEAGPLFSPATEQGARNLLSTDHERQLHERRSCFGFINSKSVLPVKREDARF